MRELSEVRRSIDDIDRQMRKLFLLRMEAAREAAAYKLEKGLPIRDYEREQALFERAGAQVQDPFLAAYYARFLRSLVALSCEYQEALLQEAEGLH